MKNSKVMGFALCILVITFMGALMTGCKAQTETFSCKVSSISKHGNAELDTNVEKITKYFEAGDLVDVKVHENTYTMPVGTSYSDVDTGEMILCLDTADDDVHLAINMGNFCEAAGIENTDTTVTITLNTKAGYLDEYKIRQLSYTTERSDYPEESDQAYANFRACNLGNIKENLLYRSSSPIDPDLNRAAFADEAAEKAGIKSIINLTDTPEEMAAYEGYDASYYSSCKILNIVLGEDFTLTQQKEGFRDICRFIINEEGPYLIHCKMGKDRTGVVIALLAMIEGADLQEIEEDYMETYRNLYKIDEKDEAYGLVLENSFVKSFEQLLQVEDLEKADLKEAAKAYALECGLSENEVEALTAKLSGRSK